MMFQPYLTHGDMIDIIYAMQLSITTGKFLAYINKLLPITLKYYKNCIICE